MGSLYSRKIGAARFMQALFEEISQNIFEGYEIFEHFNLLVFFHLRVYLAVHMSLVLRRALGISVVPCFP